MKYTNSDHTFVICAYKENQYLEECVLSVINQTVKSKVLISTPTPNEHINGIAKKYDLEIIINSGIGDMADDFNFAYSTAKTMLVTICHQDDYYEKDYLYHVLKYMRKSKKPLILFTDYYEKRNGSIVRSNKLLKIKKMLLFPLRFRLLWANKFIRRSILSLGSPICCPSVTYNKSSLNPPLFDSYYKNSLDWAAWEKISRMDGDFVYCNKPLVYHRIYNESTTSVLISNNIRSIEDEKILNIFWPKFIAKIIFRLYKTSQDSNMT